MLTNDMDDMVNEKNSIERVVALIGMIIVGGYLVLGMSGLLN
jgi:hypothetical protein